MKYLRTHLRLVLYLFIIVLVLFLVLLLTSSRDTFPVPDTLPQSESFEKEGVITPSELVIPSIDVKAPVEEVGVDSDGNMAVPKDLQAVGWYEPGYKPGQKGHAVFSGHVNSKFGFPTIFRNLDKMKIGDEFYIQSGEGETLTFVVTEKNTYDFRTAPLEKIYGPTDVPTVNLVTCDDGLWLSGEHSYKDRLVVTGVLVPEKSGHK